MSKAVPALWDYLKGLFKSMQSLGRIANSGSRGRGEGGKKQPNRRRKECGGLLPGMEQHLDGCVYLNNLTDQVYEFMSPKILELTGYSASEFTPEVWRRGQIETKIWGGDRSNSTIQEYVKAYLDGTFPLWQADTLYRRKDGRDVWIHDLASPIRKNGKVYSVGILTDISMRKNAELELEKHAEVMNLMAMMVLDLLSEGHKSMERDLQQAYDLIRTQYPVKEIFLGTLEADHQKYAGLWNEGWNWTIYSGEGRILEQMSRAELEFCNWILKDEMDSDIHCVKSRKVPMERPARFDRGLMRNLRIRGELLGVAIITFDTSSPSFNHKGPVWEIIFQLFCCLAKKNRDFEVKRQSIKNESARQKQEALGMMAEGICHEFNNLFQGILINLEEMDSGTTVEGQTKARETIRDLLRKGTAVTQKMALFTGSKRTLAREVDMNEFAQYDLPALLRLMSMEEQVVVSNQLPTDSCLVRCVPHELRQSISALVGNAWESLLLKHGEQFKTSRMIMDSPSIRVILWKGEFTIQELKFPQQLEAPAPGDYFVIDVEDSGTGMTEETMGNLFQPFFSTKFMGRGLGLAFVLGFVRTHRGSLQITSTISEGTRVRLFLPLDTSRVGTENDSK